MKSKQVPPQAKLPAVQDIIEALSSKRLKHSVLVQLVREELANIRKDDNLLQQLPRDRQAAREGIANRVARRIDALLAPSIRKVINATGIVLHTGLGRAPLGREMFASLATELSGYVNLEFDLESGQRGQRLDHPQEMLRLLSGAASSAVVNNNAAGVLLTLNTLAEGREVIVSRGELIEIGGSFRLPDVMEKSGAIMKAVGTTNRTHLKDYRKAISERTGAIVVAHTSNYRIQGFTACPDHKDIIQVARKAGIPAVMDLGSGALVDTEALNLPPEPLVSAAIQEGFDVVTFSGDKLLGGPQAGVIVGRTKYISRIRENPLMRTVRCDKLILGLLGLSLRQYLFDEDVPSLETYRLLTADREILRQRAEQICSQIPADIKAQLRIEPVDSVTEAGSGSMPTAAIPSAALVMRPRTISETELARRFRRHRPPVIGYLREGALFLDLKSVAEDELQLLQNTILNVGKTLIDRVSSDPPAR